MNHKTSLPLEAESIGLCALNYDSKIDDPFQQQGNKEQKRCMKICQGLKAALVHHHLYQS